MAGRLILGLNHGEEIFIGADIIISRAPDHNGHPRLSIQAPKQFPIERQRWRDKQARKSGETPLQSVKP